MSTDSKSDDSTIHTEKSESNAIDPATLTFGKSESEEETILDWDTLDLSETSRAAIGRMGYDSPTEVQQKSIPRVHAGVDIVVQAKTGSGKTLSFGLPILERLEKDKPSVQSLVLTPTRELALQVSEEISRAGALGNKIVVPIYGGASMNVQINRIREGAQVVVGTPGRILDHLKRRTLSLDGAWMVVLDEADEMLDRGFLPDVMRILEHTPSTKQTMLFSATIPSQIEDMAKRYLREPETIRIGKAGLSINYDIHHSYYRCETFLKFVALVNILHSIPRTKVLIFCNMKSEVENVASHLHDEGFLVGFLSGDLSQNVRDRTLDMFKQGEIEILVATDVAARGIDIFGVSHVINYDVPDAQEMYIHRTGRTGRAGRTGEALSIVAPADILSIGTIKRKMGVEFKELTVPTKQEVAARDKEIFIERLKAMESEGYPDDLALLADAIIEEVDSYAITAGLLTLLRQHGWEMENGYDPDDPKHKRRKIIRPPMLGLMDIQRRKDRASNPLGRRGSHSGRRPEGRRSQGRTQDRRSRPDRESKYKDSNKPRKHIERCWLSISLGSESGFEDAAKLAALVCQTAGVKKVTIGKVEIGATTSRFQVAEDAAQRVIDGFERRKKSPQAKVERS